MLRDLPQFQITVMIVEIIGGTNKITLILQNLKLGI